MGWVVVYIAPNRPVARMMRDLLRREGFLVTMRPAGGSKGEETGSIELLVPSSEARDASELLTRSLAQ
ncbi:MAG: glutamate decarboxylase [Limnochordaceae bacterium]|nr:glutamate decarboxylase [Limnochordaceae bacterium]